MGSYTEMLLGNEPQGTAPPPTRSPAPPQQRPQATTERRRPWADILLEPEASAAPEPRQGEERGFFTRAKDWVTGDTPMQYPDAPEFGSASPVDWVNGPSGKGLTARQKLKIAAGMLSTPDEQAQADIIANTVPGTEVREDRDGNVMVRLPGQEWSYLNKPGLSYQDATGMVGEVVKYFPVGRVAGAVGNVVGRMVVGAGGSALTSVGSDMLAGMLGSEQGIDYGRAAVTGASGGLAEGVAPLVMRIAKRFKGGSGLIDDAGRITPKGERVLRASGVDPSDATPEVMRQVDDILRNYSPDDIDRMFAQSARRATEDQPYSFRTIMAEADKRASGIPYTKGQLTGDVRQIAREEAMRNAARGAKAQTIMAQTDDAAKRRVTENAMDLQGRLGGSSQTSVEAAGRVQDTLQNMAAAAAKRVDDAYALTRGTNARISTENLRALPRAVARGIREADVLMSDELTPGAMRTLRDIARLSKSPAKGTKTKMVTIRRLERLRRTINARLDEASKMYQRSGRRGSDVMALATIKRQLDGFLDDAFDNGLFEGDQEALRLLKNARAARADYARTFEAAGTGDDAGRLIEKILDEDRTNLEVANYLWGTSRVGEKGAALRLVKRLKDRLGPESDEIAAIKEGAWHRLVFGHREGADTLTPGRMVKRIDEALNGPGKEYFKELFSPEELAAMRTFRRQVSRLVTPREAMNPSKTGYEIARLLQDMSDKGLAFIGIMSGNPVLGAAAGGAAAAGKAITNRGAAAAATRPALPRPRISPLFLAVPAGVTSDVYGKSPIQ